MLKLPDFRLMEGEPIFELCIADSLLTLPASKNYEYSNFASNEMRAFYIFKIEAKYQFEHNKLEFTQSNISLITTWEKKRESFLIT